jgi:hypothetical protein
MALAGGRSSSRLILPPTSATCYVITCFVRIAVWTGVTRDTRPNPAKERRTEALYVMTWWTSYCGRKIAFGIIP